MLYIVSVQPGGGGQEKIPGRYGGLGGWSAHRFYDFFLPILGILFWRKNLDFLHNSNYFVASLPQSLSIFIKIEAH